LAQPDYWWYSARSGLLETAVSEYVGRAQRVLDVGSADGPSVEWLQVPHRVALDIDVTALESGDVCGSALALPFNSASFDVVTAFDVLEHCTPEALALSEWHRVLIPGGRLLISVPAYEWAWSKFDEVAGHHRRYTRRRLCHALEAAGFRVERCTHIFAGTLPLFAVQRLLRRIRPGEEPAVLPEVHPLIDRVLLGLCRIDEWLLRRGDLPCGSSVVAAAVKV